MIISHEHKFIFFKTHKCAGTSIEFALTRFAGEDGIVTPFVIKSDEADRLKSGHGAARNYGVEGKEFKSHMLAWEVKEKLGDDVFNSYFKFTVERNSYDKAVSMYAWRTRNQQGAESFDDFVCAGGAYVSDFDRYCVQGIVAADLIIPYENLQAGLDRVAETLGLPAPLDLAAIRRKSGYRDGRHYRAYYSDKSRRMIEMQFAREIALFGYAF